MQKVIDSYGKETARELLDLIIINGDRNSDVWRPFLIKHGIIKKSTKTIRTRLNNSTREKIYKFEGGTGSWHALEEPYMEYNINFRNGRNEHVFSAIFKSTEFSQLWD